MKLKSSSRGSHRSARVLVFFVLVFSTIGASAAFAMGMNHDHGGYSTAVTRAASARGGDVPRSPHSDFLFGIHNDTVEHTLQTMIPTSAVYHTYHILYAFLTTVLYGHGLPDGMPHI